jgi:adenosylcobinamide-phosphate synthase
MAVTLLGMLLFSLPLWFLLRWLTPRCWPLALLINAVGLKLAVAFRGLVRAACQVAAALKAGDLCAARRLLSWHLVSRDTAQLPDYLLAAATVESVAENLTDGLAAPLFFYLLGGLPAAWAYRFANTCDSMLGYRDAQREYLGKFSARLDDLLNWMPARLTALAIVCGAALAGTDARRALAVMAAQHGRTASPNAGWTMSAMAGALGVTLEKVGHYRLEGGAGALAAGTVAQALAVARATLCVLLLLAICLGWLWLPLAHRVGVWP